MGYICFNVLKKTRFIYPILPYSALCSAGPEVWQNYAR